MKKYVLLLLAIAATDAQRNDDMQHKYWKHPKDRSMLQKSGKIGHLMLLSGWDVIKGLIVFKIVRILAQA